MGIYIHIPFCRSKCFYCGFYSVASVQLKNEYITALCKEMELRKNYLHERQVDTLYLGGGTPSYLDIQDIEIIVNKVQNTWNLSKQAERTIEMNPEDATEEKLLGLRQLGFNRLSIGIQSFNDDVLKRINRTHTSQQAVEAVERAAACGFDNISIDLIIGLPGSKTSDEEYNLEMVHRLPISHVSIYMLSIDSNSVFEKLIEKGKFKPEEDDILAEQYLRISDYLKHIGYEHYEISNFAKNFKYSMHNTSYWQQKEYIGLGASAHSYDLESRQWNISNLKSYISSLNNNKLNIEKERLTENDKYNESIMTNLRTMWGLDLKTFSSKYPHFRKEMQTKLLSYTECGLLEDSGSHLRLTERGWLVSDRIFSDLFIE
ncbi:MAG: radical SAM family heme chaperone HemW [Odoribacter sp.]